MEPTDRNIYRVGFGFLALAAALILIGICVNAQADDFPPGEDQIVPLAVGERAPFDGQLYSTDTAIRWGFRLQSLRFQLGADVDRAHAECNVQTELLNTKLQLAQDRFDFDTGLLRSDNEQLRSQVTDLSKALAEAGDTPWWRSWTFGVIVGVVGAAALAIGGAYLAGAV